MAFEIFKMGKLSDHLESEAYEWVAYQITETYGLELTKNEYGYEQDVVEVMTKDHVSEIEEYLDTTYKDKLWIEPYANTALNSIVDRWRDENDVWDTADIPAFIDTNQEAQDEIAFSTGKVPESPPCMSDAPSEADSMGKLHNDNDIMPDGYPKTFKVPD